MQDAPLEEMLLDHESYEPGYKTPQISGMSHYRCLTEAMHYLLLRKGLTQPQTKAVMYGLRVQMSRFIANDLQFVNGLDDGATRC